MANRPKSKDPKGGSSGERPERIRFHYIKSNEFRTIHVDGIHGGLTPQGLIQMAVFSERFPIPRETVHSVAEKGLGPEIRQERVSREGIVREVDVNLIMSATQARSIAKWLNGKAQEWDKVAKAESSLKGNGANGAKKR
jgi:hypothetical protein